MIKVIKFSKEDGGKLESLPRDPAIDEEDTFDYSKVLIKKPWGHEYLAFKNKDVALWILHINQGFGTSLHCHPSKKTSLVVLRGEAKFSTLNNVYSIKTGDGFLLDKGVFHMTESVSSDGILIMETETPNNKKNLVRLDDKYGREGKRYESGGLYVRERDNSLDSFHKEEECYNSQKNFGHCSLVINKYKNTEELRREIDLIQADALAILRGQVLNDTKHCVFEHGDVVNLHDLKNIKDISILNEVEILFIKAKNTLA